MSDQPGSEVDIPAPGETEFSARVSWWSRLGEFALGALWAVFVLALIFPPSGSHAFLWFTLPFGTLMATHFLGRAFSSTPRLVVDSAGIIDRTSFFGGTLTIPWEEVLGVKAWGGGVEIEVRDPRALRRRAGLRRRAELLVRRALGRKTVLITPTFLGVSRGDLVEELRAALHRFERTQLGFPPQSLEESSAEGRLKETT